MIERSRWMWQIYRFVYMSHPSGYRYHPYNVLSLFSMKLHMCYAHCIVVCTGGNEGKTWKGTSFIGGKQQTVAMFSYCYFVYIYHITLNWETVDSDTISLYQYVNCLMLTNLCNYVYRRKRRNSMRKNFKHWRLVTLFFSIIHRRAGVHYYFIFLIKHDCYYLATIREWNLQNWGQDIQRTLLAPPLCVEVFCISEAFGILPVGMVMRTRASKHTRPYFGCHTELRKVSTISSNVNNNYNTQPLNPSYVVHNFSKAVDKHPNYWTVHFTGKLNTRGGKWQMI